MTVPRLFGAVTAMAAVALAAWWFGGAFRETRPEAVPASSSASYLPEFTLPDLDDQPRASSEWVGESLILNFWATWCAPCRREMPLLQALHEDRGAGGLRVVGLALDNPEDVRRYIAETGVTYTIVYGEQAGYTIAESLGDEFIGLPFSAFVAPGGEIVAVRAGEVHAEELQRLVAELDAVSQGLRTPAQARDRLGN